MAVQQEDVVGPVLQQHGFNQGEVLVQPVFAHSGIDHFPMLAGKGLIEFLLQVVVNELVAIEARVPVVDLRIKPLGAEGGGTAHQKNAHRIGWLCNRDVLLMPEPLAVDVDVGAAEGRIVPPAGKAIAQGLGLVGSGAEPPMLDGPHSQLEDGKDRRDGHHIPEDENCGFEPGRKPRGGRLPDFISLFVSS